MHLPTNQIRRSMTTKKNDSSKPRAPTRRPSGELTKRLRQLEIEDYQRRQNKLWAKAKHAASHLPDGGDLRQRKRALGRIFADIEALSTSDAYINVDRVQKLWQLVIWKAISITSKRIGGWERPISRRRQHQLGRRSLHLLETLAFSFGWEESCVLLVGLFFSSSNQLCLCKPKFCGGSFPGD